MMTLEEANKITRIWGMYLDYVNGKLNYIFEFDKPESLLPFPQEVLFEALGVIELHYRKTGNSEAAGRIRGTMPELLLYKDDEESIIKAAKSFSDPAWRKSMLPALKEFQQDWIKLRGDMW